MKIFIEVREQKAVHLPEVIQGSVDNDCLFYGNKIPGVTICKGISCRQCLFDRTVYNTLREQANN